MFIKRRNLQIFIDLRLFDLFTLIFNYQILNRSLLLGVFFVILTYLRNPRSLWHLVNRLIEPETFNTYCVIWVAVLSYKIQRLWNGLVLLLFEIPILVSPWFEHLFDGFENSYFLE